MSKTMKITELVEAMHAEYRKTNPYCVALDPTEYDQRRDKWRALICAGHELEDLRRVLKYLNFQVEKGMFHTLVLGFRSLIGNVDNFRHHLEGAKLWESRYLKKQLDRPKPESQLAHGKWEKKKDEVDVKSSMRMVPELIRQLREATK